MPTLPHWPCLPLRQVCPFWMTEHANVSLYVCLIKTVNPVWFLITSPFEWLNRLTHSWKSVTAILHSFGCPAVLSHMCARVLSRLRPDRSPWACDWLHFCKTSQKYNGEGWRRKELCAHVVTDPQFFAFSFSVLFGRSSTFCQGSATIL